MYILAPETRFAFNMAPTRLHGTRTTQCWRSVTTGANQITIALMLMLVLADRRSPASQYRLHLGYTRSSSVTKRLTKPSAMAIAVAIADTKAQAVMHHSH